MKREEIEQKVFEILKERFEIAQPDPNANLRETYNFDSIDAIELLAAVEDMYGEELSQELKKQALEEISTVKQVIDMVERIAKGKAQG